MMNMLNYGLYQRYSNMGMFGERYEIVDTDVELILRLSVPDISFEDLSIKIREGNRLVVKSDRDSKFTPPFKYVFSIPCEIIKEETVAKLENGMLDIILTKRDVDYKVELR